MGPKDGGPYHPREVGWYGGYVTGLAVGFAGGVFSMCDAMAERAAVVDAMVRKWGDILREVREAA